MIDSIHIVLNKQLCSNTIIGKLHYQLTNIKTTNTERERFVSGNFQNFKVTEFRNNITINGSLNKFVYGHNLVTMRHDEIKASINDLSAQLSLPLFKGHIARLDIGENIAVKHSPAQYFNVLLDSPGYYRNAHPKISYGVSFRRQKELMTFYNKSFEALENPTALFCFDSSNIIRIELRILSNVRRLVFNSIPRLNVIHLFSPSLFQILASRWRRHYEAILKRRNLISPPILKTWKDVNQYLSVCHIYSEGVMPILQFVEQTSIANGWSPRQLRIVKKNIVDLQQGFSYSKSNVYTNELDNAVKRSYTYQLSNR